MKTFLNTICVIVLMLSPLAFNSNLIKNHKSKLASSQIVDNCEYYKIHVGQNDRRCMMYQGTSNYVHFSDCINTTNPDNLLWRFINNIDGTVSIVSKVHNQQYMEITRNELAIYVTTGSPNVNNRQKWYMRTSEGLTYFQNENNNLCMSYHYYFFSNNVSLKNCSKEKSSYELFRLSCEIYKPAPAFTPNDSDCSNQWTQIVNRGNNMCVKFENIKNRVVQGTCGNGDEFLWRLEALDDGHYMIYSKKGNYVIDSHNVRTNNGNPVWNWDPHRGDSQRLEIKRSNANPSFFNLIYKHSKKCLDVPAGSKQENIGLAQYDCIENNHAEEFKFKCPSFFIPNNTNCSNNWTQIVNRASNKCIRFYERPGIGRNQRSVNTISPEDCGNGDEFLWRFEPQVDRHYIIYSKKGNFVIDSIRGMTHDGNIVMVSNDIKADHQRLDIIRSSTDNSFYTLVFKHSKKCLEYFWDGYFIQNNCIAGKDTQEFKFPCP